MTFLKSIVFRFNYAQLNKKDFTSLEETLLSEGYTVDYTDNLVSHLKVYLAGSEAGYKLMPSADLVSLYKEHSEEVEAIVGEKFTPELYDVSDKYSRYRVLDISVINKIACITASLLRKFDLKIYNSKKREINPFSRSNQLAYNEEIKISK